MTGKAPLASLVIAVMLTAALLVSGCGGDAPDPGEALASAAKAAREAGSAHTRMNVTLSPLEEDAGMSLNIQGDAWMDMDAGMLEARFTVMGMEISLRCVGADAYIQFGGGWYLLSGEVMGGMGGGTIAAATEVMAAIPDIISTSVDVKELGTERLGDLECTRMEVLPDLKAITGLEPVRRLAAELGMDGVDLASYLEDAEAAVEVWVQKGEPAIRRVYLAASVEMPSVDALVGIPLLPERARVEITVDFSEYGVTVDVLPPVDAQPFRGL